MYLFTTIFAGVSVFVIGQIFLKWMVEPIQELRKIIAEVMFYLANDHYIIHNAHMLDREEVLSSCKNLKRLGANLLSCQQLIPFYKKLFKIFRLPSHDDIVLASKRLSLISNSAFGKERDIYCRLDLYRIEVCEALGIEDPIQGGMSKVELQNAVKSMRNQKNA